MQIQFKMDISSVYEKAGRKKEGGERGANKIPASRKFAFLQESQAKSSTLAVKQKAVAKSTSKNKK